MKILAIIFCLLPSMLINAQVIDWNSFNERIMNDVTFSTLNEYTEIEGGYSLFRSSSEHHKIYKFLKKNNGELLVADLITKLNDRIHVSSVGILDSISFTDVKTYQEFASRCILDLTNSPSDAFFMIGWGKAVDVTSLYNNRTGIIYISLVIKNNL